MLFVAPFKNYSVNIQRLPILYLFLSVFHLKTTQLIFNLKFVLSMLLAYLFKNYSVNIQLGKMENYYKRNSIFKNYSVNIQHIQKLDLQILSMDLKTTQLIFNK